MPKSYFKEKQHPWIWIILLGTILTFSLLMLFQNLFSNETGTQLSLVLAGIISVGGLSVIFQMKTEVNADFLHISYGFGFLKRKIPISTIDLKSFEGVKIAWYYGMLPKMDFQGNYFYTVKPGNALRFKQKNRRTKMQIGTKNRGALKKAIINAACRG